MVDLRILLSKCFIAEADLGCFLLEKAKLMELNTDDTFKLKHLTNRVSELLSRLQASDERYHSDLSDDNVPLPYVR